MSTPAGTPPVPSWEMEPAGENDFHDVHISSGGSSGPGSRGGVGRREKKRVGFGSGGDSGDQTPRVDYIGHVSPPPRRLSADYDHNDDEPGPATRNDRHDSDDMPLERTISKSHLPELSLQQTREIHEAFGSTPPLLKHPRSAIRRTQSSPGEHPKADPDDDYTDIPFEEGEKAHRRDRMRQAFERGKRLEDDQRSAPASRQSSPERHDDDKHPDDLANPHEDDNESDSDDEHMPTLRRTKALTHREAERLVRRHTRGRANHTPDGYVSGAHSIAATPPDEQHYANDYRPRPEQYRGGVLGSLLKLYNESHVHDRDSIHSRSSSRARLLPRLPRSRQNSETPTPQHSPPDSGTTTPNGRHWYSRREKTRSTASLSQLIGTSSSLGLPVVSGLGEQVSQRLKERKEEEKRQGLGARSASTSALAALNRVTGHRSRRLEDEVKITVHIAETIARHRYLMRLCKALMMYGAPTHRLEEYMRMSARVLEIEAQFLYIPGSMIMSFDDSSTHTTEVKLVRVAQGLDLGRLRDVHEIYKQVVHDRIGVEEATQSIKDVTSRNPKYSRWIRIPVYGLAAAFVGPFAFEARLIDLPIAFLLGCILGVLQLVVAPASDLYANVFEVSATVITSFLARAFGSIWHGDKRLFCFSALAQSSIALILPGYIVLCASLELQSRQIVAGSIRMVYAIIYSLFLGFGITIGTAIYGLMDSNATSETYCPNPLPSKWNFLFVAGFAGCLLIINQAKLKQAPVMIIIALIGYTTTYFSAQRFVGNTQVSSTLGALAIGVMANLYSRIGGIVENWCLDWWEDDLRPRWRRFRWKFHRTKKTTAKELEEGSGKRSDSVSSLHERATRRVGYGLAAAAMLPAIFVQVPSGLSVNGSLVAGIASANQIVGTGTNGSSVANTTTIADGTLTNSIAFTVSYSVVQVAIGITVGLFLSAIVVYPFGKRRSGLFSL